MGLDIKAYSRLTKNEELTEKAKKNNFYIEVGDYTLVMNPNIKYIDEVFPNRATPLEYNGDVYDGDASIIHCIGAYSTYGNFRIVLEQFSEECLQNANEFDMLLNFSDCEGVFGSIACKELYEKFESHSKEFEEWIKSKYQYDNFMSELFKSIYLKFKDAFSVGMNGGAVEFC